MHNPFSEQSESVLQNMLVADATTRAAATQDGAAHEPDGANPAGTCSNNLRIGGSREKVGGLHRACLDS